MAQRHAGLAAAVHGRQAACTALWVCLLMQARDLVYWCRPKYLRAARSSLFLHGGICIPLLSGPAGGSVSAAVELHFSRGSAPLRSRSPEALPHGQQQPAPAAQLHVPPAQDSAAAAAATAGATVAAAAAGPSGSSRTVIGGFTSRGRRRGGSRGHARSRGRGRLWPAAARCQQTDRRAWDRAASFFPRPALGSPLAMHLWACLKVKSCLVCCSTVQVSLLPGAFSVMASRS